MSQIHPVQLLLDEHVVIESVLAAFEMKLLHLRESPFPIPWFSSALDFFHHFVEGCHHNREEELVFPHLRDAGLLDQHDSGKAYLDKVEAAMKAVQAGDPQGPEEFRREGLAYVQFLRDHINQEDELLHWVANRPATELDILRLHEGASPKGFHQMDEETYERYLALADSLSATLAV